MPYQDFLAELGKAGLTVRAFADLIGMNRNSVSNYAIKGEVPRHLAVIAMLLVAMCASNVDYRPIFARVDRTPRKARGRSRVTASRTDTQTQLELR